jgi:hypothetical protein
VPPSSLPNKMWGARDNDACRASAYVLLLGLDGSVGAPYLLGWPSFSWLRSVSCSGLQVARLVEVIAELPSQTRFLRLLLWVLLRSDRCERRDRVSFSEPSSDSELDKLSESLGGGV